MTTRVSRPFSIGDPRAEAEIRAAAAIGSRDRKTPDSVEFAYQTASWLRTCYESKQISYERYLKALAEADENRVYERIPVDRPYGSLAALVKGELGVEVEQAKQNKRTAQEQAAHPAELARHGEVGNGRSRGAVITSTKRGETSAEYLTARIARDHPDILQRMQAGEFKSVAAAAKEAGIYPKRVSVNLVSAEKAARTLRRVASPEFIMSLMEALRDQDRG
jgi:hypothetical protein